MSNNLDLLYQEYVRLQGVINSYAMSSFDDFKLLAVIGVMFAWEPLATRFTNVQSQTKEGCRIIFFGFVAILFVLAIISTRDLLKQSIIMFEIHQTGYYEEAIRQLISPDESKVFQTANEWEKWRDAIHIPIAQRFHGLFVFLAMVFPAGIMWKSSKFYSISYLVVSLIVIGVYWNAVSFLRGA